ncbi:hypothetical protein B1757_14315 [Acidithiobacillus marinus]|uniref:carbonic anhydrase n=1 Tax=Acidithiobacillus marinus TaxID=187490 RepID=A0A2I1DI26_9PROT|nr:carbonic anhydrase [Acidithiobacillus marinus]PKY09525.1 hypothetical protein B1757_14315 [Acidithiobacillus marinus]
MNDASKKPIELVATTTAKKAKKSDTNSRRQFLQAMAVASAGVALPGVALAETAKPVLDQSPEPVNIDTPEAALAALMDGNRRFRSGKMVSCKAPIGVLLEETVNRQTPFAAVLSCSDSRVPIESIFDQELGRVFVARVAGNIATPEMVASLEYGVAVLGTKLIMVIGHSNCGAVKSAMTDFDAPGQITSLYQFIRPAIQESGQHLGAAIHDNARIQAKLLAKSSPLLAKSISEGTLRIVPAYYSLATGEVTVLKA